MIYNFSFAKQTKSARVYVPLSKHKYTLIMKRNAILWLCLLMTISVHAQNFTDFFQDKTLRIDYILTGDARHQSIYLDELSCLPSWAGQRHHLSKFPRMGNGQITMTDTETGKCIYRTSFSTLFQEWLSTDEAQVTAKAFENSFLLPYPQRTAEVEITLFTPLQEVMATMKHTIRPNDILIHQRGVSHITPHRYILKNGDEAECIDIAILAEGYTEKGMDLFYRDAEKTCESIFFYEPFKSTKNRFNVVAVASPSRDSGVSVPRKNDWKQTAFSSHFDTFYSDRYLTTDRIKSIHNALAGIPYEHIIILANTDEYGGGGIYNSYTLTAAHHPDFKPVIVHEFGHSFAGLGDEYFYDDDVMTDTYPLNVEPWEPNITTLVNFSSKWKNMLPEDTPVPTLPKMTDKYPIGVYEGAGYSAKGIYRPSFDCRMRTNEYPEFCPVCQRAILEIIDFYTNN